MRQPRTPGKKKYLPPFETEQLRKALHDFLRTPFDDASGDRREIGSFRWGAYLFYDYDGEPIYAGQTYERVSQRIGRHLTNQRTDPVAMSVLDPFEVFEIEVWPLPQFENVTSKATQFSLAKAHLNALEYAVHQKAIKESKFRAILNETDPPMPAHEIALTASLRGKIVSDEVFRLRSHPDVRIARRAQIISRLAQTISERKVKGGLRRSLVTQARRLDSLSDQRFVELGGQSIVTIEPEQDSDASSDLGTD